MKPPSGSRCRELFRTNRKVHYETDKNIEILRFIGARRNYADLSEWTGASSTSVGNRVNWVNTAGPKAGDDWLFDIDNMSAYVARGDNEMLFWGDYTTVQTVGVMTIGENVNAETLGNSSWYFAFAQGSSGSQFTEDDPLVFTIGIIQKHGDIKMNVRLRANKGTANNWAYLNVLEDVILDANNPTDDDSAQLLLGGWGSDLTGGTNTPGWKKVTIGGKLDIKKNNRISFNAGSWANTVDWNRYDAADVEIKGGTYLTTGATFYFSMVDAGAVDVAHQTVFHVNGVYGDGGTMKNQTDAAVNTILVFTNDSSVHAVYSGSIEDKDHSIYGDGSKVHTKIVMNGEGSQTLTGEQYFTAGIDVLKGTLTINQKNSISMGDLMISGGTFSVIGNGTGIAYLDSINYKGGTLAVGFGDRGDGTIVADMISLNGTFVNAADGKILIDLDLTNIKEDGYYNLIMFGSPSNLTADDFECITDLAGTGVEDITFEVNEGGLFVNLVIPEASSFAAIAGALALAFAFARRRR